MAQADKWALVSGYRCTIAVTLYGAYDQDLAVMLPQYWHCPFPDGKYPPWSRLEQLATEVAAALRKPGACAVVMCHAGRNRSGAVNALIVRELMAVPGWQAIAIVRDARPGAIANQTFESYLQGLPSP